MKRLYKDILNGSLMEENIPTFFNGLADNYHTSACVRLAMHYFSFYETYLDDENLWSREVLDIIQKLNEVINNSIMSKQSGSELEAEVRQVDKLRNKIMDHMKQLTVYTDIFQVYEYILNRVEYRFKEGEAPEDTEEFAREVLQYIFDTEDNFIINDKIREMVGQLPIRMTKQRYFDMIRGSINEYKGAPGDTLDTFLYMLKTSAMLESTEDMKTVYPALWENKTFLEQLTYKNITQELFQEAEVHLRKASQFLPEEINVYYNLQEIINVVYAILIVAPYTGLGMNSYQKQDEAALSIISDVNRLFAEREKQEASDETAIQFHVLEGVQEELSFDLTVFEDALYQVDQNHRKLVESIMAGKQLNVLLLCKDLLSNSLFIDFYEIKSALPVSEERIKEEADQIIDQLSQLFEGHDRMVTRAVMANTLNKLPVFFQDHKEIMDYVLYSLEKCSDMAEKQACIDMIRDIMSA